MVSEELINKHYIEAALKYNQLEQPSCLNGKWYIKGKIDVIDDEGGYWDTYSVYILIPDDYPQSVPIIKETSKKIEQHENWHNGAYCCLSTEAKMYSDMSGKITLLKWLDMFVHPYLANHVYKLKTGNYAGEEFEHGINGIITGYLKIFGLSNKDEVIKYLGFLTSTEKHSKNIQCFCKSGKNYKRCFMINKSKHFLGIPIKVLKEDLKTILNT